MSGLRNPITAPVRPSAISKDGRMADSFHTSGAGILPTTSERPSMIHQTNNSSRAEVTSAAEQALAATSHALETTKELASQAIERAGEKARDLREGVKDASAAAQRQLGQYAKATGRYVSDEPVKSALIAAALGAAVAALVMGLLRNKRRQD